MKLQHYEINAGVALCRATHGAFLVDVRTPAIFPAVSTCRLNAWKPRRFPAGRCSYTAAAASAAAQHAAF